MPNPLIGKRVILGVTGSIAAYKAAEIASKLTQSGAFVDVILTESACKFISPLSFQSLTGRKAYTDADLWGGEGHVVHIDLGHNAEMMIIAPASANSLAKLANGIADNLLTVTALAASAPLIIAPAMDAGMYAHPATNSNVDVLQKRGAIFLGPTSGHLASGLSGHGRMIDPSEIVNQVRFNLSWQGPLSGRKVVVTAGGTSEPIDPVRVITNRSSGKQGFALAQAALDAGANVSLITTPNALPCPFGAKIIKVNTAQEMLEAVMENTSDTDLLIMAAAVADFRHQYIENEKFKKEAGIPKLTLERTADILQAVSAGKESTGYPLRVVGFAAESQYLIENATKKLKQKRLDMIAANDISLEDAGFEVDTNRVVLIYPDGNRQDLGLQTKIDVAETIIYQASNWFNT